MNEKFWIYLLIMAGVTYLIRMLPLVLIRKEIKNRFILSFLHYIPYAVLSAMTIPAIFTATDSLLSAVVGFLCAVCLAFFGQTLTVVALFSCMGVFITELIMRFI